MKQTKQEAIQQVCELLLSNFDKRACGVAFFTKNGAYHYLNHIPKNKRIVKCCPLGMWALVNKIDDPYSFYNEGVDIFPNNDEMFDAQTEDAARQIVDLILEDTL